MKPKLTLNEPWRGGDGRWTIIIAEAGTGRTTEDPAAGLAICVVHDAKRADCQRRAQILYDALVAASNPSASVCPSCGGYGIKQSREDIVDCRQCEGSGEIDSESVTT